MKKMFIYTAAFISMVFLSEAKAQLLGGQIKPGSAYVVNVSKPLVLTGCSNAVATNIPAPLVWSSSHPAVAAIDSSTGIITPIAPGTTTITATNNGVSAQVVLTVLDRIYTYNTSGSFTHNLPSAGLASFTAEAYGGGAGGGEGFTGPIGPINSYGGSGGGGGAYSSRVYTKVGGIDNVSYTVGAGGTAGGLNGSGWYTGGPGGNSTVTYNSTAITAGGGAAATHVDNANGIAGPGGTATGGTTNVSGNPGVQATSVGNESFLAAGTNGGSSALGTGAGGLGSNNITTNGGNGTQPGGGGGGSSHRSLNSLWTYSGAGGTGRVIITYTCP